MSIPGNLTDRRSSLRDVAREAGVSHTTVSLILNGKLQGVPETRERVLEAVKRLDYQPDALFRRAVAERIRANQGKEPSSVKTQVLALILPHWMHEKARSDDGYYSGIFAGACEAAVEAGWHILLCPQAATPTGIPSVIQDGKVDGILIEGTFPLDWLSLLANQRPCAFVNAYHPGLDAICVTPNWERAGYKLLEYAWGMGHRNFVFFRHDKKSENLTRVVSGHETAMEHFGGKLVHPQLSRPWPISPETTDAVIDSFVDEFLAASPRPTVIISSDLYCSRITQALARRGLTVPDTVSLLGRDGTFFGVTNDPPLTTYAYPVQKIGYQATRLLVEAIQADHLSTNLLMLEGCVVERSSMARLSTT